MPDRTLTNVQMANAMNLVAMMTIDNLAREDNISPTEMLLNFMSSQTALALFDPEDPLWTHGPAAVMAEYRNEIQNRHPNASDQH